MPASSGWERHENPPWKEADVRLQGNAREWVELAAKLPDGTISRGEFVPAGDVEAIAQWRQQHGNTDLFISAARFARPAPDSLYRAGFFLCVGGSRLEEARRQATASLELLFHRLDILPECVEIGFDGANGFELAVPLTVFGSPRSAPFMRLWRSLAGKLAGKGVGGIDLSAYRPDWLLRLPNSRNSDTGLYVYPLEFKELRGLSTMDIRELAAKPRDAECLARAELSEKARAWFEQATRFIDWRAMVERSRNKGSAEGRVPPGGQADRNGHPSPDTQPQQVQLRLEHLGVGRGAEHPDQDRRRARVRLRRGRKVRRPGGRRTSRGSERLADGGGKVP
jgi:hypothetical protein